MKGKRNKEGTKTFHTKFKDGKKILTKKILDTVYQQHIKPLLRNVVKWLDTLEKSCSKWCKIFKVCLTILRHCKVKG